MIPIINPGKIYSILGNNNSLVPLAIKDCANSMGLTAGSYITGDAVEGKDRFIDEFGTQAIWLFGIPTFKKILDLTMFKSLNYDPNIDVRLLNNKNILEKAKEFAPTKLIKEGLEKVSKNQKTFKGLSIGKFALSTALTMATYFGLTKFRHKFTENQIKKEYYEKQFIEKKKFNINSSMPFSAAFKEVHEPNKPSFTGLADFMFSPVKNLMIVDGAITGERLAHARNKQDFVGYAVKEGTFWAFMYFAGAKIQKLLETHAENKHKKSIDLDARVIESKELKNAFENKTLSTALNEFPKNGTDVEIYEFVNKNPNNFIVKMAKKSNIIQTIKKSDKIDTRKYIDIEEIKSTAKKLEKLEKQYLESKGTLDDFLHTVRKLKRSAVRKNLGACVGALGVVVPGIMIALRFLNKGNKDFQTKKEIEAKLAAQN